MSEKILKPYLVTLESTAVVMAEDETHAYDVARMQKRDICSDGDMSIFVGSQATTEADLTVNGWDGMCVPYGGDGNTRLKDIFAALDALPTRDTKTVDMFEAPSA